MTDMLKSLIRDGEPFPEGTEPRIPWDHEEAEKSFRESLVELQAQRPYRKSVAFRVRLWAAGLLVRKVVRLLIRCECYHQGMMIAVQMQSCWHRPLFVFDDPFNDGKGGLG